MAADRFLIGGHVSEEIGLIFSEICTASKVPKAVVLRDLVTLFCVAHSGDPSTDFSIPDGRVITVHSVIVRRPDGTFWEALGGEKPEAVLV